MSPAAPSSRPPSPHGGLLRKRYVIPSEHGVWAWWIGPFLIGVAAAGKPDADLLLLVIAAFASFFLHQPAALAVKGLAGRGSKRDIRPALTWVAILGGISLACVVLLVLRDGPWMADWHALVRAVAVLPPACLVYGVIALVVDPDLRHAVRTLRLDLRRV